MISSSQESLHAFADHRSSQRQIDSSRRVLVFPAGTEIGLEIHSALSGYHDIHLFGAGEPTPNHARFVFDQYYEMQNVRASAWLAQFIELCETLHVNYVFPAHDDAIIALSNARAEIPATIVTSSDDVCQTTRSKSATYRRLAEVVPVPYVYSSANEVERYPVFVKPDRGQGSQGVQRVDDPEHLELALRTISNPIICEYLPGDEYTVDCFSNGAGILLFAGARRRNRTRNGIAVSTETVSLTEANTIASAINSTLKPRGAWFFQLKRSRSGTLTLLEVAPRIAGSMAAHRMIGVNFPLLSILDLEGAPLQILTNHGAVKLDRALCNRYRSQIHFDILYLDFDDTLAHRDTIDERVMQLLCMCLNQGIHTSLITETPIESMRPILRKISHLFDEVIQAHPYQSRGILLDKKASVYVDNNSRRRLEVSKSNGIPTFDVSMIELIYGCAADYNTKGIIS